MSAVRSEDTVERFRTSVDMKRNHVANNWAKHYLVIDVVRAKFAFYLTLRVCDRSTRTHGCHNDLPTCVCDVVNNV